ncbi:prostate stem cell antigen-like [Crotalus tigris]|uniref:prostate stem cell antigen-like n=1 Tax=Crotalus tigris TaxID=88082 RepID=UPI00192F1653|nr:prostate stem cell antigen-like [Crotalus tigris]
MNVQANQTAWRDYVPFSAEQIQPSIMRAVLYLLLTGVLLIEPSGSLWCYTCRTHVKSDNCKKAMFCKDKTKSCKTDVIKLIGLLSIVSKECASSCTTYYKDMLIVRRNVSCCSSDLCNVGGTSASPTNGAQMAMVAFISSACIILSRLL